MSDELTKSKYRKMNAEIENAADAMLASSFAAPTGLAARVVVNQALVDEIIRRARASHWGLDEAEKGPDMDVYADSDIDALAQCLVSSWTAKYDLVSVFSAAMSVIQEKAANDKISHTAGRTERNSGNANNS